MTVVSSTPTPPVPRSPLGQEDALYAVKRAHFLGKPVTYICQNINGPCPLLAISNLLLLRGHITVDAHVRNGVIAASGLIMLVRKRLVDANPPLPESNELGRLTQQKTIEDVNQLMPSLLVGLDVNIRFHSITDFEYTVACAVFDMLDIALVHGWLLDVQDERALKVIQNKSYNELIERLVDYRGVMMTEHAATTEEDKPAEPCSSTSTELFPDASAEPISGTAAEQFPAMELDDDVAKDLDISKLSIDVKFVEDSASGWSAQSPLRSPAPKSPSQKTVEVIKRERQLSDTDAADTATALLEEGPVLEEFFETSASQLTYYGLVKLHEDLRERQLAVFFRNNHFGTLFKHDGALYLLVTDAGYLDEPTVVWERLNEIDGDSEYFDENFRPLNASETRQQTLLQQQEEARRRVLDAPANPTDDATVERGSAPVSEANTEEDRTTSQDELSSEQDPDYLLALKLQQEEEALATRRAQSQPQPPARASGTNMNVPVSPIQYSSGREPSEGYDSQPPSQGPNNSSEGDAYMVNANGDLVLSDAELQAQQEAALYYQQQRELQQTCAPGQGQGYCAPQQTVGSLRQEYAQRQPNYQPNRAAAPAKGDARRQNNDCRLM